MLESENRESRIVGTPEPVTSLHTMPPRQEKPRQHARLPRQRARRQGAKWSVSIIGAGRLGTALGIALRTAGYRIQLVAAKSASSAHRAAKLVGGRAVGFSARDLHRLASAHHALFNRNSIILIATPDDAIATVADELAAIYRSLKSREQNERPSPA